jgi:hypothetical protein
VRFFKNKFRENNHDGVGISLRSVEDFISEENIFEDIGLLNGKYGIAILGETKGKTKTIKSIGDIVSGKGTTAFSAENPGHKTETMLNLFQKGRIGKLQNSLFDPKQN